MRSTWIFSISYYRGESIAEPNSIGIQLSTPKEVEEFADYLGAEIPGRNDPKHHSRGLRVELLEDDPRLQTVIQQIESKYGWKPSKWFEIPLEERARYFGIRKIREYTKSDVSNAAFLMLLTDKPIAKQKSNRSSGKFMLLRQTAYRRPRLNSEHFFLFKGFASPSPLAASLKVQALEVCPLSRW